jgi:hypothetical protein
MALSSDQRSLRAEASGLVRSSSYFVEFEGEDPSLPWTKMPVGVGVSD